MKLGFMTSVCPKYTLPELLQAAKRHGYQGVEPRVEWQHGNLLASQAAEVITRAEARHCMILWHAEHHIRNGESVDRAWVFVKPRLCHYQWSDVAKDVPEAEVARTFPLMKKAGFEGSASV